MFEIIIFSLVTWRITFMLVNEEGPYDLVEKFRNWSLQSKMSPLWCFRCCSVWVAGIMCFFTTEPLLYWLAISAISILVNVVHEKLR